MLMKCVQLCLTILFVAKEVEPTVKTWKYNNDVTNKENWENGRESSDCRGLIFPERIDMLTSVRKLTTDQIILPNFGDVVLFEGATILFTSSSSKCIKIKDHGLRHWLDPDNWIGERNEATPNLQRVPCDHDDVVFPKQATFSTSVSYPTSSLKSLSIFGKSFTNSELQEFMDSVDGEQLRTMYLEVSGKTCRDPTGCVCHEYPLDETSYVCEGMRRKKLELSCTDPIYPKGHCVGFCGGMVTIEVTSQTNFEELRKNIPRYENVDAYAMKYESEDKSYIQVTFAEKGEYTGESKEKAQDFYDMLKKSEKYGRVDELSLSGLPYHNESAVRRGFAVILGTFLAAVLVFGLVYYVYVGPGRNYGFDPLSNSTFSFRGPYFKSFYFARFENTEGGDVKFQEDSSVDSARGVLKESSFDNPLYGQPTPMVSKRSDSIKSTLTETSAENPLYAEMEIKEEDGVDSNSEE